MFSIGSTIVTWSKTIIDVCSGDLNIFSGLVDNKIFYGLVDNTILSGLGDNIILSGQVHSKILSGLVDNDIFSGLVDNPIVYVENPYALSTEVWKSVVILDHFSGFFSFNL